MEPRTICILGCGGFIGSHLVDRILAGTECHIHGIDKVSAKIDHALSHPRMHFVAADVYDVAALEEHIRRSDVVISLVALCNPALYNTIPVDVIETNFTHPVAVARLCAQYDKWLVHFSTSEVYGKTMAGVLEQDGVLDESTQVLHEDTSPLILGPIEAQRWSYAAAKQLAERMIYAYGFERNLQYTVVRPFNFIGPRMDYIPGIDGEGIPRVLACFIEALMRGRPLKLVNGGRARRTFTYIDDAIDAVMAILEHREAATGEIFNIGNPANEVSIAELAETMIRVFADIRGEKTGVHAVEHVSGTEFYGVGYDDSDRRMPDVSKAQTLLEWEPRTGLTAAVRRSLEAYLADYQERIDLQAAC